MNNSVSIRSLSQRSRRGSKLLPWMALAAVAIVAGALPLAKAQEPYPNKALRIIVPFAPAGGGDTFARIISEKLATQLGQTVVVENRAGADTAIGTEAAARAAPDGYTLLLVTTTQVVNMSLKERVGYDLRTDFEPVVRVAEFPLVLVVSAKSSIHSVADLVALAKLSPAGLSFVSGGTGTTGHLAGELFKQSTGISAIHVPYKGTAAAVPDLIAGRTDFFFSTIAAVQEMAKAGHLRMLATTMNRRLPSLPNVPTMKELGYAGFDTSAWFGFMVPAKTPKPVVDRLYGEIAKIVEAKDVQERLAAAGLTLSLANPQAFGDQIRTENASWARVIKTANIKLDN